MPNPGRLSELVKVHAAAGAGQAFGDAEQAQPSAFGWRETGFVPGPHKHLHPGGELAGERDDGAPDLILRKVVPLDAVVSTVNLRAFPID
jgi:hypothetical protein